MNMVLYTKWRVAMHRFIHEMGGLHFRTPIEDPYLTIFEDNPWYESTVCIALNHSDSIMLSL